jgi:hypothetical protein
VKTSGRLEVTFHELEQDDLMVFYGSTERRKRLRPRALVVKWDQRLGTDEWRLWHVWLAGELVRQDSHTSGSMTLYEAPNYMHEGGWAENTPDWVKPLVEQSRPAEKVAS